MQTGDSGTAASATDYAMAEVRDVREEPLPLFEEFGVGTPGVGHVARRAEPFDDLAGGAQQGQERQASSGEKKRKGVSHIGFSALRP